MMYLFGGLGKKWKPNAVTKHQTLELTNTTFDCSAKKS